MGTIAQKRDPSEAVKLFNESLSIYRAVNDKMGVAIVIHHLGMIEQTKHHYPEARELYNQSLKIKRELGYRPVMAVTLFNLAKIELDEFGDLDKARALSDESLEISKESGDWLGVANTLHQLYEIEYWRYNYVEAKKFYDQSQEIKRKLQRKSTND